MILKNNTKKPVRNKKDWTRAQIIAALHDKEITLAALAKAHGLADSTSFSSALSHSYPRAEQRIADALNLHPMKLWPTRYDSDGTRIKQRYPTRILPLNLRK